jgi:hypothetical protein
MGKTPIQYLNYYRIECACELLSTSERSVSEVALSCGFKQYQLFHPRIRGAQGKQPVPVRQNDRQPGTEKQGGLIKFTISQSPPCGGAEGANGIITDLCQSCCNHTRIPIEAQSSFHRLQSILLRFPPLPYFYKILFSSC